MTRTGDREIGTVSGRLPDNPGELACMPVSDRSFECHSVYLVPRTLACEQQTHFRLLPLSLFFGGREATTGNASAVRRLQGLWLKYICAH